MRSRREVVRDQKIVIFSALFIAVAVIICSCLFGSIRTQAAPAEVSCKYYTSIEIKSGDTLWSIASEYITDDYSDMNEYIDEICSMNHIDSNDIHSGQYITIPYYAAVTTVANN